MKKDVLISFVSTQENEEGKDSIEFVTEGRFYKRNDGYYITYKESELTGMEGTTTTLKVEGSKVTMMRFGTNNTQMIFERGHRHICCYDTEYGALSVGVSTSSVKVDISDNGGEIYADYNIDIDNNEVGKNDFRMQIKECH